MIDSAGCRFLRNKKGRRVVSANAKIKKNKPSHSNLISASVLVCENVLVESDGGMSIIRLADIFFVPIAPDIPVDRQTVMMRVLVVCKFKYGDNSEHTVELQLIRPDGATALMGQAHKGTGMSDIAKSAKAPGGFNVVVQTGIIPKQMGTHYVVALLDGKEVARTPFTLVERKAQVVG